jgi:hypothetical protein
MRSKYKVGLVICLLALLCGCNGDDSASNTTNPFAGIWNITFSEPATGGGQIAVGPDGNFTANFVLLDLEDEFTGSGEVSNSGTITNGRISNGTAQVGTFTGNFTGNTGTGTYLFGAGAGTWSANKQ